MEHFDEIELRKLLAGEGSPETYNYNYLIEAGAGAGKTHIMVNRIVNRLLSGEVKPDNIAAITFTEKATQEMLSRIDSELMDRLKKATGDTSALKELIESIDRMQVSTIHGFCSKMLKMMPFESELGPDFTVMQDDETALLADTVFDRAVLEEPQLFSAVREMGVKYEDIRHNFLDLCEEDAEISYTEMTEEVQKSKMEDMLSLARVIAARVKNEGGSWNIKNPDSGVVKNNRTQIDNVLKLIEGDLEEFAQAIVDSCFGSSSSAAVNEEALVRVLPGKLNENRNAISANLGMIENVLKGILHSRCVPLINALIERYRQEKRRLSVASNNDLLRAARDMLAGSYEARSYFHKRFASVYVDEMQDTDPVQAQILFYLTTDEEHFDASDWTKCRPVPGSLFLVGDPKQAIYRFRNADISIYMELERLFTEGVGRVERLHFNFRSAKEITDFADKAFMSEMQGGKYQAMYSPMTAYKGSTDRARIIAYKNEKGQNDAQQVAAFIAEAVDAGVIIRDKQGNERPARYGDFMVLTSRTKTTADYVEELSLYGIPSNMAGSRNFADAKAVSSARMIVEHLLDSDDAIKLVRAMNVCYNLPLERIRDYRNKAGRLSSDCEEAKQALGNEFADVFRVLDELRGLYEDSRNLPAYAALSKVCFNSAGAWMNTETSKRAQEYAALKQLMGLLAKEEGTFGILANRFIELSCGAAARELLLADDADCVQIMNLHKAKGLEAVIIILAADKDFSHLPSYHRESGKLHTCLTRNNPFGGRGGLMAAEDDWEDWGKEESSFLTAETVRLLYVAATRAMTCLVVNTGKGAWQSLAGSAEGAMNRREKIDMEDAFETYDGEDDEDAFETYDTEEAYEEIEWVETDPAWIRANEALKTGVTSVPVKEAEAENDGDISPEAFEKQLSGILENAKQQAALAITPSSLETDKAVIRRNSEDDEPVSRSKAKEFNGEPFGAEWGTVIHRVMELAVSNKKYDKDSLLAFSRQAVHEAEADENWPLLAAEKAEAVLQDGSPLRELIDGADCYTELPFILHEDDADSFLAKHVHDALSLADDRPIDLNGIIDLAVFKDGEWTVVDYKTDRIREGEEEIMYAARLKGNYKPQLLAYRAVLERLGSGNVGKVYICAVNLGGRLIELK